MATTKYKIFALISLAAAAPACTELNRCGQPVANPDDVLITLKAPLSLDEAVVWTQEAAIGDLLADAFLDAFRQAWAGSSTDHADAALLNAGAIRQQRFCDPNNPRQALPPGDLHRVTLREVLPFDDNLVVVELTALQLKAVLEHGVARAGQSPAGQFPQVAGLHVTVDCGGAAEALDTHGCRTRAGARVAQLSLDAGTGPTGKPRAACTLFPDVTDGSACADDVKAHVRLVTLDFLVQGGDSFLELQNPASTCAGATAPPLFTAPGLDVVNFHVAENYLTKLATDPSAPPVPQVASDPSQRRTAFEVKNPDGSVTFAASCPGQ